jgi:hypothetical protein
MRLPTPTLTANYEQRQGFIDFLINKRIATKDEHEGEFLEWLIAQQVEYRGPEQFPPPTSDPPTATLLAELKLNAFGQPEDEPLPTDGDDAASVEPDVPVPPSWPEDAEEDPGGYGFPI